MHYFRKFLDGDELYKVKEVLEHNNELTKHGYGVLLLLKHIS